MTDLPTAQWWQHPDGTPNHKALRVTWAADNGRAYKHPTDAGTPARPSVSNILGRIPETKYGLDAWRIRTTAEYAADNPLVADAKAIAAGARLRMKEKANYGTAVHNLIDAYLTATDTPGPPTYTPPAHDPTGKTEPLARRAAHDTLALLDQAGIEPLRSETVIYGQGYAGTADLLAYLRPDSPLVGMSAPGRPVVVDYKTGRLWPTVCLQLTAYAHADEYLHPDGIRPFPGAALGLIIHLPADGPAQLLPVNTHSLLPMWQRIVGDAHHWAGWHKQGWAVLREFTAVGLLPPAPPTPEPAAKPELTEATVVEHRAVNAPQFRLGAACSCGGQIVDADEQPHCSISGEPLERAAIPGLPTPYTPTPGGTVPPPPSTPEEIRSAGGFACERPTR